MEHYYMPNNCEELGPYIEEHKRELSRVSPLEIESRNKEKFPIWFKQHPRQLFDLEEFETKNSEVDETLNNVNEVYQDHEHPSNATAIHVEDYELESLHRDDIEPNFVHFVGDDDDYVISFRMAMMTMMKHWMNMSMRKFMNCMNFLMMIVT
ncbi:hypothetical protein ACH5RR_013123 [Cinchona calisaya]|uniref:Uncharacterized protein n=1 Tax=Cinchona calisaya TaxID=153742 RepID=A0ABD2ZZ68_9GENT